MTSTILEPMTLPPLSNQPNVEIAQTGQWDISTGRVTLTDDDFSNAVSALDCPAVRKPVLKIGHTDTRFDGEPCVGWIDNMATTDSGGTIRGDYVGMPGWLGPILASAYPDRSMEATWDYMCQLGHVHPFVITAVALLGVTPPGIGTLQSLQDIPNLYGVNASSADNAGHNFTVMFSTKGDDKMPAPQSVEIAAGVTAEDVRRNYYETAPYSVWIKEIELEPLQLITLDEATGQYARVPINLTDNGAEFGEAVPVQIEYVDTPTTAAASRIVYASKDESRPNGMTQKVEKDLPPKDAIHRVAKASNVGKDDKDMDSTKIREALGLAADASDDDVLAAASALREKDTQLDPTPTPVQPLDIPEGSGVVAVDRSILAKLQDSAKKGEAAYSEMQKNKRDAVIARAIETGKFAPARREHWEKLWDADPVGTENQINNLSAGLVPLKASGYPGTETAEADEQYFRLYPEDQKVS